MQETLISHAFRTFLLRTTLTEEDIAVCSRTFRNPKMSGEKSRLIENATRKSTGAVKKQHLKRFSGIFQWQENEKLVLEPCVFTTEKCCVQRSYTAIAISIYTFSDLGNSSNLIGQLSRTMTLYSPRQAVNIKQNKLAVVNWVFQPKCRSKAFLKIPEYPSADDFEGKKRLHGA